MTLDELIAKAIELRTRIRGDALVIVKIDNSDQYGSQFEKRNITSVSVHTDLLNRDAAQIEC